MLVQEAVAGCEASGMTSTWDEFLCVELNENQSFTLYTGRRGHWRRRQTFSTKTLRLRTMEFQKRSAVRRSGVSRMTALQPN